MSLDEGTQIGPYRIQGSVGAGGMGEVYRALDPRLGRQVAVKVIPARFASDPERVQRFEQEARAAGALNHPNILAVHDLGSHEGSPFVVYELLEGESLRHRLGGSPLPVRKSLDYASQIALGLAAAHERGIVHRDLKPENLFVTNDGRVKILDFGLAKLTGGAAPPHDMTTQTMGPSTEPGRLLGTVGYMSPEQVRSLPVDHRSDIFTFGAIIYEMLSGRRAFQGDSAVETMNAILKEDPPDLTATNRSLPPELERIVRHCLEKSPAERFQSARDLAFDLETVASASGPVGSLISEQPARRRRWTMPLAAIGALAIVGIAGFFLGRSGALRTGIAGIASAEGAAGANRIPDFTRLTFRRGQIRAARFATDSRSIAYSAEFGAEPSTIYTTSVGATESRALGFKGSGLLAVSSRGELAIAMNATFAGSFLWPGTLARVPLTGEAPRPLLEGVSSADWTPDGERLAIVRDVGGRSRLELPVDTVLFETAGWISHPRTSPSGDRIAFLHHPLRGDDGGEVGVVELGKPARMISPRWRSIMGMAWSPDGSEVWFTAAKSGLSRAAWAVDLSDRERLLLTAPGGLTIHDVARDGAVLVSRDNPRMSISALRRGETLERDLSWLDWSLARDLSEDGETLLFDETGEGGGASYGVYVRKTDGSPAVRLGNGAGFSLSPDGKWAIIGLGNRIALAPTGTGTVRDVPTPGIEVHEGHFLPDGDRILLFANEKNEPVRAYITSLAGGAVRPLHLPAIDTQGFAISPDGAFAALADPERKLFLCPTDGGPAQPFPGFDPTFLPIAWSKDGRWIYGGKNVDSRLVVRRFDVQSGRGELFKEIPSPDVSGVARGLNLLMAPDGSSYAYSYVLNTSDLYLVRGVK